MLDYLELLMLKPSSYSGPSVRDFLLHPAKQIELRCLEWTSSPEIRNKAVMFFKLSDLKLSQTKTSSGATSANFQSFYFQPRSPSTTKPDMEKDCRLWNLDYDSCSCHKSNSHAFNAHHKCRMCTKEHPMLHCPKRRNPIPPSNTTSMWLLCESLELEQPTFLLTKDSHNDTCTSYIFKSKTVYVSYLHHSTYFSLSAGSAWRFWRKNSSSYISEHWDVGHLTKRLSRSPHHQLINYTADTLPASSLFNHPSAITFPDHIDHFISINWISTRRSGRAKCS